MATFHQFEDLPVWQEARSLAREINVIIQRESFSKNYRLKNQMDGSSGSVMDNIAEGFERNGNKEFIQFLSIAKSSCGELRSQLYRAFDFGHISQTELDSFLQLSLQLSRNLSSFGNYLKKSEMKGSKFNDKKSAGVHSNEVNLES